MSTAPDNSNVAALPKPQAKATLPVSVDVNNPTSLYLDTAVFEQIQRVAVMMSRAGLAPSHLRGEGKVADCILVVAQALRWKSDPFAVAQHTFVTQGKLGYEGKLIAAMVNSSGKLKENLDYEYSGDGDGRKVVVSGTLKGSEKVREIDGTVGKWKTANEFWKKNPDQMLAYRGAREWARRHMPEVLLGVNSEEDVAQRTMVDVTPRTSTEALNNALANAAPSQPADDMRVVEGEVTAAGPIVGTVDVDADTGELIDTGSAAESASTLARLLSVLPDLPDVAALAEWKASVANERASLTPDDLGAFNTAYVKREQALGRKK